MATERQFLRDTFTEPGADGSLVFDLSPTQGSPVGDINGQVNATAFTEVLRWQRTVDDQISGTSFPTSIDVSTLDGTMEIRWRVQRIDSSGAVQASSAYSQTETTVGIKTAALTLDTTWAAGDRLAVSLEIRRTGGHGTIRIDVTCQDADSHVDADLAASEPELLAELATESDAATDADLSAEPELTAEPASESDQATDAAIGPEPVFSAEEATEADTAADAVLETTVSEPELTAEPASETDVAVDAALGPEPILQAEAASEVDASQEAALATEPTLVAEEASETDTAVDAELSLATSEPEFSAEMAAESDVATEAELGPETVFAADEASESDQASEAVLEATTVEPELAAEPASETDTSIEADFGPEPAFPADLAAAVEEAFESVLASEPLLAAELASESDSAFEAGLAVGVIAKLKITVRCRFNIPIKVKGKGGPVVRVKGRL